MKKILLASALVAMSSASFAQKQLQEKTADESLYATSEVANVKNTCVEDKNYSTESASMGRKKTLANGVWYARPKGALTRSFTRYDEESGQTTPGGGYSLYNAPLLSTPVGRDIIFPNMCKDKAAAQWGFNNNYFGEESLYDENNDGVRGSGKRGGSFYIPQVKVGEEIFFWGEEAYTSNSITTDDIVALSYEEKGANNSMYTGFTDGYAFGTVKTAFDFDKDGTAEENDQYAVEASYPAPPAPISFDFAFAPALTHTQFFTGDQKITLTIYNDLTNKIVWQAQAGAGDFTGGTTAFTDGGEYGMLKFQKMEKDEDGGEYTVNCTIDFPYTVVIEGYAQEGVDLGFRMVKRTTYEAQDAPKMYRYYQNKEGKSVGSLSWTSNTYGLPLAFHGLYDVIDIDTAYVTSSGLNMKDMNVMMFSNDGQETACGTGDATYPLIQLSTQMAWYDAEMNENYFMELPEWVTAAEYEIDTEGYCYGYLGFKAEPLPATIAGRGTKVYVESFMGGKSNQPIYFLQGNYTKEQVDKDFTPTAITRVAAEKIANNKIYNVAGQEVGNNFKGIVIKNGKKFIK